MTDIDQTKEIKFNKYSLPIGERTCIMGVLNVTPDSFSDGGECISVEKALERALLLQEAGADMIDVGGESSRPGAESVSVGEELERVIPVIRALKDKITVPISIDTCKSEVAEKALEAGASIVNDITALGSDKRMGKVVSKFNAGLILMHMKGDPGTMQDSPQYEDVVEEVFEHLLDAVSKAESAGVDPDKIIVDPGIGFGKTIDHNLKIINSLKRLKGLGKPILVGTSRKSFIGSVTGKEVSERAFGTAASISAAIIKGADIVRVHDVAEMRDVARVTDAIIGA